MSMDIHHKNVLITGANRGIGKAIAEAFLDCGAAKVYAAVRNIDSAKPLIERYPGKVVAIAVDLSKPESITAAAELAADVDIVINNAGVFHGVSPLAPDAAAELAAAFETNVYGLLHVARAFAPVLKANGGGALVQLNSVVSIKSFGHIGTYPASKAASYSLTQSLRELLADQGTLVVSVHPGPIETDMANQAGINDTQPPSVVADAIIEALKNRTFHVFPDKMARQLWAAYQPFAQQVVEREMAEA